MTVGIEATLVIPVFIAFILVLADGKTIWIDRQVIISKRVARADIQPDAVEAHAVHSVSVIFLSAHDIGLRSGDHAVI